MACHQAFQRVQHAHRTRAFIFKALIFASAVQNSFLPDGLEFEP